MAAKTISDIESRLNKLEQISWCNDGANNTAITSEVRRARRHVQNSHCYSSKWVWCPLNYYELKLEERKQILGAHTISQLCKACLFENKNYVPNATNKPDPSNSQYYLIIVQYVESINTNKLSSELRSLRPPSSDRLDPKYFSDMRLAPEEVSEKLTGYSHNGVSPFGMLDRTIPIIVSKSVLDVKPRFIWMGGGHKELKLGMAVSEFVNAVDAIVLDISESRILK